MSRQQINNIYIQLQKNIEKQFQAKVGFLDKRRKTPQNVKNGLVNTPFGLARKKTTKSTDVTNTQIAYNLLQRGFKFDNGFKSGGFWMSQGLLKSFKILYVNNKFTQNRYYNLLISAMKKSIENTKTKRNAPITIKIKGRDSPARDTLQFLESVTIIKPVNAPNINSNIPLKIVVKK